MLTQAAAPLRDITPSRVRPTSGTRAPYPARSAHASADPPCHLPLLAPRHAAPLVPGLDDEELGRVGQRHDDELADLAAKQVRGAGAALAADDPLAPRLVEALLGATRELGVAAPARVGIR